jgi:hypothetical protein
MNIHEDIQALTKSNQQLAEAVATLAAALTHSVMLTAAAGGPPVGSTSKASAKAEVQAELPLEKPAKPKAGKAKPAPEPEPEPEVEEAEIDPLDDDADPEPEITRADVAEVLKKLERPAIMKLLEKHGAATLKEVDPDAYPALLKAANAALAKLGA